MSTTPPSRHALSLDDVLRAIAESPLAPSTRRDMASAVRTFCRLVGRDPPDIPADAPGIARRLDRISPAAHGLGSGRMSNIRSLLRAALALVRPVMPGRSKTPMSGAWAALYAKVATDSDRIRLSRLLRWLSAKGVEPDMVKLDTLEDFRRELLQDALLGDPEATWTQCVVAWNRAVGRVPGWPALRIARVSRKQTWTLPWSAFPPSLKADVDGWLDRLGGRDLADDGPARPARPRTLATREYQLRTVASALVLAGRDAATLRGLADLVTVEAATLALRFLYERNGHKTTTMIHAIAGMLKGVARHWVKVEDATLRKLDTLARKLAVPEQGMTETNRQRLRPLDDPAMVERLVNLPLVLKAEIDAGRVPARRVTVLAQIAVAIELLLMAPVRRENLAGIDLDRHLVPVGDGLHLVIPADEVKNRTPIEFALPADTVALIRWYCQRYRPGNGSRALFPGRGSGAKKANSLAFQVQKVVFERTGLKVNLHLFRHMAAKIYLDAMPGGYEVVRRVLAHRRIDTTTKSYAGQEAAAAARHFDSVILRHRTARLEVQPAGKRKKRRA